MKYESSKCNACATEFKNDCREDECNIHAGEIAGKVMENNPQLKSFDPMLIGALAAAIMAIFESCGEDTVEKKLMRARRRPLAQKWLRRRFKRMLQGVEDQLPDDLAEDAAEQAVAHGVKECCPDEELDDETEGMLI